MSVFFQAKMSDNFAELGWTFFTIFSHFIDQTIYRLIWKIIVRLTGDKNNLYLQPQQTREYFAHSPPFSSSFVRPLQSMLWIKLPFKKRAMFCESRCELAIQTDHSHWGKTENTNVVCEHVCLHEGWFGGRGGGVFWSPASWMRSHPCLREKRPLLWGLQASGHQWDAHAHSHTGRDSPPMSLNYTIVLSHSTLPRLVRHHLLSPQKAL